MQYYLNSPPPGNCSPPITGESNSWEEGSLSYFPVLTHLLFYAYLSLGEEMIYLLKTDGLFTPTGVLFGSDRPSVSVNRIIRPA